MAQVRSYCFLHNCRDAKKATSLVPCHISRPPPPSFPPGSCPVHEAFSLPCLFFFSLSQCYLYAVAPSSKLTPERKPLRYGVAAGSVAFFNTSWRVEVLQIPEMDSPRMAGLLLSQPLRSRDVILDAGRSNLLSPVAPSFTPPR